MKSENTCESALATKAGCQKRHDEAGAALTEFRHTLETHQAEAARAKGAFDGSSIDDAPRLAEAVRAADARVAVAQRQHSRAEAALALAASDLSAASSAAHEAACKAVIGTEVRPGVQRCIELYAAWQEQVAKMAGASMAGLLDSLTMEEWRALGNAIPTLTGAAISVPGPAMAIGENWPDHRPLRVAAFEAKNAWLERIAELEHAAPPAREEDPLQAAERMKRAAGIGNSALDRDLYLTASRESSPVRPRRPIETA